MPGCRFWTGIPLILLCASVSALPAQVASEPGSEPPEEPPVEVDEVSPQLWVDYNPSIDVSPSLRLFGDLGVRLDLGEADWVRVVARPSVRYDLSRTVWIGGGVGNFFLIDEAIDDRWELRPWQGVNVRWPTGKFPIQHWLRLEERFDFNTATWTSKNSLRARYQISISRTWATYFQENRFWRAFASLEGFMTLAGEQGQSREQVRAVLGIRRSLGAAVSLQGEIAWQKRGLLFISDESVSDIFLRVGVFHRM